MSTAIQWSDETWNPTIGCTVVSEGCRNCYAAKEAVRLAGNPHPKVSGAYAGLSRMTAEGQNRRAVFTGTVRLMHERLDQPLRWRKPRRIFVDSMSDLFHPSVPDEYIDQVMGVAIHCPDHTFQILTKRPERAADYMARLEILLAASFPYLQAMTAGHTEVRWGIGREDTPWPLPNVWLGTSVEDQQRADERIPHLLRTPAAVRFLSCEPLLGPVDLRRCVRPPERGTIALTTEPTTHPEGAPVTIETDLVQWVIVGGESGPHARPCDVSWIRSIRDQCWDVGVACFVKQLGARPVAQEILYGSWGPSARYVRERPDSPEYVELRDSHGGDPDEWPEDLRIREFPA